MGLTWIDHDTIEKPIEEIKQSGESGNLDIEFKVETLRQNRDGGDGFSAFQVLQNFAYCIVNNMHHINACKPKPHCLSDISFFCWVRQAAFFAEQTAVAATIQEQE